MESYKMQDSQDAKRHPIPVVNGEAKPSSGKKKKILLSFAGIVLVAGLGSSLFLLNEEKQRANEFADQAQNLSQEKAELEAEQQTQLSEEKEPEPAEETSTPEGWSKHDGSSKGYSFFHPEDWKVNESKSSGFGDYKPLDNIDVRENTSGSEPKAFITLQRYQSVSKDDLFKVLKSKQYWDGKCEEHTSVIADTLVYGLSCGPDLVNGQSITNYYVLESGENTFVIYHDQLAGEAGPQQKSLVYQGVLSSLSFDKSTP